MKDSRSNKKLVSGLIFVFALVLGSGPLWADVGFGQKPHKMKIQSRTGKPFLSDLTPAQQEALISNLNAPLMRKLAFRARLTTIRGKDMTQESVPSKSDKRRLYADKPVESDPFIWGNNPSIAVHPKKPDTMVAACVNEWFISAGIGTGYGLTYTSKDKGLTWLGPKNLPMRYPDDLVLRPVLRYAPTGAYLYCSYLSVRSDGSATDLYVARSTNHGLSWSAKLVLSTADWDGDGYLDLIDDPWLEVHKFPTLSAANGYVYLTCTLRHHDGDTSLMLLRSSNYAVSWASPSAVSVASPDLLDGARAIGGKGSEVLFAFWWANGSVSTSNNFCICFLKSGNYGATWDTQSSIYGSYQLDTWLGPSGGYHYWRSSMWPSIAMDASGVAWMAFTSDPVSGSDTQDGIIRLYKSTSPFEVWSQAGIIDPTPSGTAGYPTVGVKRISGATVPCVLFQLYNTNNLYYEIYAYWLGNYGNWESALMSDAPSISEVYWIGDHMDIGSSLVNSDRTIHVIWTDRSDKRAVDDYEDDVYTDMIEIPN